MTQSIPFDPIDDHSVGMPKEQADRRFRMTLENKRRDLECIEMYNAFNFCFFAVALLVLAAGVYILALHTKPAGFKLVPRNPNKWEA